MSPTATTEAPSRRLGRRILSSRFVEALASPHGVDRYLELIDPSLSLHDVRAEVVGVRRDTPGSVVLTLRPNANWPGFRAGQFVRVAVEIDGVRETRCYSPACSEHAADGHIEITVKAHPEGRVSGYLNDAAHTGMVLDLFPAEGDFTLPRTRPDRLLLISGGSGITPVMSMLRTLCDEGYPGDVTFLHYARSEDAVPYRSELSALAARHPGVRVLTATTRSNGGGELRGHFGREHLMIAAPEYAVSEAFVCGPSGLVEAVRELWWDEGLEPPHVEHFTAPATPESAEEAGGEIHFVRTDRRVEGSGGSLLEQAEAAGLSPEFGCRMGICHTCTTRKSSGCVRNMRTGVLSSGPDENVQICVSAPVGDVALEL